MNIHLKKVFVYFIGFLVTLFLLLLCFRFFFGGNEDSWICQNNIWVSHGKPSYPKPDDPCGKKVPLPKTKEDCILQGGVWKKLGPDPFESCNIKAADRGTICTDNSECEGWCQADLTKDELRKGMSGKLRSKGRGRCSVWRVELGCFANLKNGQISVLCID